MNLYSKSALALLTILFLSGCNGLMINKPNSPNRLVNKDEVAVQDALTQIGKGISNMKAELDKSQTKAGLYIDTIDLDIALNAIQNEDGSVSLGINPLDFKKFSDSSGKLNADVVKSLEDSRSSSLKIRFKSVNGYRLQLLNSMKDDATRDGVISEDLKNTPIEIPYKNIDYIFEKQ